MRRTKTMLAVFIAIFFVDTASAQVSSTVDLYIFAGQSNMKGHVATQNAQAIGATLIPSPYKEAFVAPVTWAQEWNSNSAKPTDADQAKGYLGSAFVPFKAGYSPSGRRMAVPWGPEVAFLYHRHQITSDTIWFVKYAIGGTSLAAKPTAPNWSVAALGNLSLLDALVARVVPATDWLLGNGAETVRLHLIWAQGESDGGALGSSYARNFAAFRSALATRLERPNVSLEVATMTLVQNAGSRQAQSQILIAATHAGSQVANVHDYPQTLFIADKLHLGPEGQIRHGTDIETLERLRPRAVVDDTAAEPIAMTIRIPQKPFVVAYLQTVANGSTGLEWSGDTTGLSLDSLSGKISVSDPALVTPGTRNLILTRHYAESATRVRLDLTFYR